MLARESGGVREGVDVAQKGPTGDFLVLVTDDVEQTMEMKKRLELESGQVDGRTRRQEDSKIRSWRLTVREGRKPDN
jgi:hypothetical protein